MLVNGSGRVRKERFNETEYEWVDTRFPIPAIEDYNF